MSKLIKEIMDALNAAQKNKTEPYDRQGEVKRIEGKIAWVKLEGSDRETPIQMTIACDVGDTVQARIGGGSAWLTGNLTAPPTDDKKANQAISMVTNVVQEIQETVDEALEDIASVEDVTVQYCLSTSSSTFIQDGDWSNTPPAYQANRYYWTRSVIEDEDGNVTYGTPQYSQDTQLSVETSRAYATTDAHFWYDSTGAYVTNATKTDYKSSASNKYATRVTPTGILQSYSGNLLSSWTNSGISFYQGDSDNTPTASFGSGGAEIYSGGTKSLGITNDAVSFYDTYGTNVGNIFLETVTSTYKSMSLSVVNNASDPASYYAGLSVRTYGTNNSALVALTAKDPYSTSALNLTESSFGVSVESSYHGFTLQNGSFMSTEPYYVGSYKLLTTGTVTDSFTVNANSYSSDTVSASKTGYKAIGVVGWSYTGNTSTYCNMYVCYMDDNEKIHYGFRNLHESNNASLSLVFYVLYVASSQGV